MPSTTQAYGLGPLYAIQPEDTAIVGLEEVAILGIFRGSRKLDEEGGIKGGAEGALAQDGQ